jgi:hypothetical protein
MATQTSYTQTVGDLVASTLQNTRQEVVDNIFKKSVYLAKLMLAGRKKSDEGGTKIVRSLEYGTNGTVQSFQGYDLVPIVPQETVTDCLYDWKEYAGNWSISRREQRLNTGKAKIRSMVEQKKSNLERSFNQQLNTDLLNPSGSFTTVGNSGKKLNPLSLLVSFSAQTVGSVSESANSWWAPQRDQAGSSNNTAQAGSAFLRELRSFYNTCGQNNDGFPNFGLGGKEFVETYESVLDSKVRYGSTEMANMGFTTVMLKGMELGWDQIGPGTSANGAAIVAYDSGSKAEELCYFLNTDYIYLIVDSGTDFIMTDAVNHEPGGQYMSSGSMLFMGEHIVTNRRAQGLYYGVDISAITLTT